MADDYEDSSTSESEVQLCSQPPVAERRFEESIDPFRAALIRQIEKKWVNGTVLHYFFFQEPAAWRGGPDQEQAVRDAFAHWKGLGLGLEFEEVEDAADAEIRIGFSRADGSWSYVGRDTIDLVPDTTKRTMNFGWSLLSDYGRDTALHEIGHALGFPHEHQNPNAGIVWDRDAVIQHFAGSPNFWPEWKTEWNILRKIDSVEVEGSHWDRDSIMHYRFRRGLIVQPPEFQTADLVPAAGLSPVDIERARGFYPALEDRPVELKPFESKRLRIAPGEQVDYRIEPEATRDYIVQTFGALDTVMVLFEMVDGTPRYLDGDDDSGLERNARVQVRLVRGREYLVRLRLYFTFQSGEGALMLW